MKIAHVADIHLGFSQFQRLAPNGVNQRELDVAESFVSVIGQLIALAPDLVVVAGDVFHRPRPNNRTVMLAFEQFARLRKALPSVPVVMCAGNHDRSPIAETGSLLPLFSALGVHVATYQPKTFRFGDVSVHAVPEGSPIGMPDASARVNVLVFHGEVDLMPHAANDAVPLASLSAWDYVALGHYHEQKHRVNGGYAGSIDYTSSNPWGESPEKGFVVFDTESHALQLHRTSPRAHLVLPPISANGLTAEELMAAMDAAVEGVPDMCVVRQVIEDCPVDLGRALESDRLRRHRARLFAYQVDMKRPEEARVARAVTRRRSLDEMFADKLRERLAASPDLQPADLLALHRKYMQSVEDMDVYAPTPVGAMDAA